jgi:hypothetical protein
MSSQLDDGATSREHKSARTPSKRPKDRSLGSRWTFSKSPVPAAEIDPPSTRLPKPAESGREDGRTLAATVEKRQSRINLFDIFGKPKAERARGLHDTGLDTLPERSQTPPHFYRKEESMENAELADMDDVRPASRKSGSRTSSQKRRHAKLERPPPRDWDPPPLFQAYTQAIKHGELQGTNVSTDTLLRAANQRTFDGLSSTVALRYVSENEEVQKHANSPRHVQKRFSTLADSLGVAEKVFALTTTGRVLQYAGKGKYDRLPERVLQLGHDSAAFASDLLPGQHWVLQVIQSVNQDGAPAIKQSRSLLSRLRTPSTATPKHATSLLMIFDAPGDMDSWLKAHRKEIEQKGGKRIEPDPGPVTDKRPVENDSGKMPTHRFQSQKDAHQPQALRVNSKTTSPPASPKSAGTSIFQPPVNPPPTAPLPSPPQATSACTSRSDSPRTAPIERTGRSPKVNRISPTEVSSVAITSDQAPLEQMRNSSRYSLVSARTSRTSETEVTTIPTSCGSSSPPSPQRESFTEAETQRSPPALKSFTIGLATTTNFRRMPPQTQMTPASRNSPQIPQRESSARIGSRIYDLSESAEVPPINFSVNASINGPRVRHSLVGEEAGSRMSRSDPPIQTNLEDTISEENNPSERPASFIGQLPNLSSRSVNRFDQRMEPSRKPFNRPIPVRHTEPSNNTQQRRASETLLFDHPGAPQLRTEESPTARRLSSLPNQPTSTTDFHNFQPNGRASLLSQPASHKFSRPLSTSYSLMPLANPNVSVSVNGSSPTSAVKQRRSATTPTLRRPNSMQIHADPAPFLSSRQPQSRVHSDTRSSSEPSIPYSPSYSASCTSLFTAALAPDHKGSTAVPPILPMNPNSPAIHVQSRFPTIVAPGLPPPAHPPPNIPLPKVPGRQAFS